MTTASNSPDILQVHMYTVISTSSIYIFPKKPFAHKKELFYTKA